jgi:hypothetical protein
MTQPDSFLVTYYPTTILVDGNFFTEDGVDKCIDAINALRKFLPETTKAPLSTEAPSVQPPAGDLAGQAQSGVK